MRTDSTHGSSPTREPDHNDNKKASPHGRRKKKSRPRMQMSTGSVDDLENCEEVDKFVSEVLEQAKWEYLHGGLNQQTIDAENTSRNVLTWPTSESSDDNIKRNPPRNEKYHGSTEIGTSRSWPKKTWNMNIFKFGRSTPDATPVVHSRLQSKTWSEYDKQRNGMEEQRHQEMDIATGRKLHEKNPLIQKKNLESKMGEQGLVNQATYIFCQMCSCCFRKDDPI